MTRRALILGSGGPAAIAWEIGVIAGLAEARVDIRNADLFVGTSAGSVVAAEMTSGVAIETLFQQQVDPRLQIKELIPRIEFNRMKTDLARAKAGGGEVSEILQRVGALALATVTVSESERRAVIATRLPVHAWPKDRLFVVAVDVASGERHVFDRDSGVDLVDAVAASCAAPATWPPVNIGSRCYMDGGVYSTENQTWQPDTSASLSWRSPPAIRPWQWCRWTRQ